ncbi:MAG TPA: hypothetical protein VHO25_18795 [Polyangiaceae bacterium]|nr:hypothetical protein [Polyangiaceae bacterium]
MSQNIQNAGSIAESIVRVLTGANAIIPAAMPAVAAIVQIFRAGGRAGKTVAEMEAESADSMATALRIRSKSEAQMSDKP